MPAAAVRRNILFFSIGWVEAMRAAHSLFAALGWGICLFVGRGAFMRITCAGAWAARRSRSRIARPSLPKYCRDVFFSRRANASPEPNEDMGGHKRAPEETHVDPRRRP